MTQEAIALAEIEHGSFLLDEGLDLLSAYRAIRSKEVRRSIMVMVATIAQAEMDEKEDQTAA